MLSKLVREARVMVKINEYMTVGEASAYLGVSAASLRRWDRAGALKASRHPVSGYRLYLKRDLDEFLSQVGPAEKPPARSSGAKKTVKRTRDQPARPRRGA